MQSWDREWLDGALYEKYDLDSDDIGLIEGMIRPMGANGG